MSKFCVLLGQDRRAALSAVNLAPVGAELTIGPPTRSGAQSKRLHAMLTAIAKTGFVWGGETRDTDDLKTLLISAWRMATHQPSEVVKGLSGEPVQMRRSTKAMSKEELTDLMDYIDSWCAQQDPPIQLKEQA